MSSQIKAVKHKYLEGFIFVRQLVDEAKEIVEKINDLCCRVIAGDKSKVDDVRVENW